MNRRRKEKSVFEGMNLAPNPMVGQDYTEIIMNDTKSKVYIVQNVMRKNQDGTIRALDYSQAERFGEIIFLFDGQKQV